MISLPGWVCPAHHHLSPSAKKDEGFYVVFGTLLVTEPLRAGGSEHQISAGETLFLPAGTIHELSAGEEGAVYLEFSETDTRTDVFPCNAVTRDPDIEENVPGFAPPEVRGFPILGNIGLRLHPHVRLGVEAAR